MQRGGAVRDKPERVSLELPLGIPKLTLMTDTQDSHLVQPGRESVQGDESGLASRDHELPQAVFNQTPDQRMMAQNGDSLVDCRRLSARKLPILFCVEIENAFEVLERAVRQAYFRQRLGLGRRAALPCARAAMYRNTSSAA
jgi:hypothetical protein